MPPGRNDPCHCGSGKKFKRCHGAVIALQPVGATTTGTAGGTAAAPVQVSPNLASRVCGECTACCEGWAPATIRGHDMRPGLHCHFLTDKKCTIYDERPTSPCRNFVCGWLSAGSPFPEEFRPDRLGTIIVNSRWRDRKAYILLDAGHPPTPALIAWMQAFSRATGHPFFHTEEGETIGYGPADFQQDMSERKARGEALW